MRQRPDCTSTNGLVAPCGADPDTNRSAGPHSFHGVGRDRRRVGLVEFTGCRSDLSTHLRQHVFGGSTGFGLGAGSIGWCRSGRTSLPLPWYGWWGGRSLASSSTSASTARSTLGLLPNTRPNSASTPRMRLTQAVRSSFKPSRTRCRLMTPCCSQLLTGTKRMLGREAASQIAAASVASFLPPLPSMRYGVTKLAAISRASRPMARSRRAQWCALQHASIATRQRGGSVAHQAMN